MKRVEGTGTLWWADVCARSRVFVASKVRETDFLCAFAVENTLFPTQYSSTQEYQNGQTAAADLGALPNLRTIDPANECRLPVH